MDRSLLVRLLGFKATLIHGDTLILDRWLWLRDRLPRTANGERILDVGCGTGAFTIGAALRGYSATGLTWDARDMGEAQRRASLCGAPGASFELCDVRHLQERGDLVASFDAVFALESIEHVLDDFGLMRALAGCLRPGGRLLLTTPFQKYRAITPDDDGPYARVETGAHVRRGYTRQMLIELCSISGLACEEISFCGGFLSQKTTGVMRRMGHLHPVLAWAAILPVRPLLPLLDPWLTRLLRWPAFSICLEAYKPRSDSLVIEAESA